MKRVRGTNRSSQSLLRFRLGTLLVCSLLALLALPALWKQWKKSCVIAAGELVTVEERLRGVVG